MELQKKHSDSRSTAVLPLAAEQDLGFISRRRSRSPLAQSLRCTWDGELEIFFPTNEV
jgi:hypothetical protein